MTIDPTQFYSVNVVDTCAVWNVLSSNKLYAAAKAANCHFCVTSFVNYECLSKPRKKPPKPADLELKQRLTKEQLQGRFAVHSCDISDLQAIKILQNRRRLGMGELSSIAFAMKIGHAVITDDKKARKLAEDSGHHLTQTTPHLFSWLIFSRRLTDSDKNTVIDDHKALGLPLAPHFEIAYEMALQCQLHSIPRN